MQGSTSPLPVQTICVHFLTESCNYVVSPVTRHPKNSWNPVINELFQNTQVIGQWFLLKRFSTETCSLLRTSSWIANVQPFSTSKSISLVDQYGFIHCTNNINHRAMYTNRTCQFPKGCRGHVIKTHKERLIYIPLRHPLLSSKIEPISKQHIQTSARAWRTHNTWLVECKPGDRQERPKWTWTHQGALQPAVEPHPDVQQSNASLLEVSNTSTRQMNHRVKLRRWARLLLVVVGGTQFFDFWRKFNHDQFTHNSV